MSPTNENPMVVTSGPWVATWHGGRLMDISHVEYNGGENKNVVECIQPSGGWNGVNSTWTIEPDRRTVQRTLDKWAREHGEETNVNVLPYIR